MTVAHIELRKYDGGRAHERWSFAHVAGNGVRQWSRKRYLTRWNAKRAALKLYPGLPVR